MYIMLKQKNNVYFFYLHCLIELHSRKIYIYVVWLHCIIGKEFGQMQYSDLFRFLTLSGRNHTRIESPEQVSLLHLIRPFPHHAVVLLCQTSMCVCICYGCIYVCMNIVCTYICIYTIIIIIMCLYIQNWKNMNRQEWTL